MATIQQMLKEIRSRGISQEKIGAKIGVSQGSVSRLMRGETVERPTVAEMLAAKPAAAPASATPTDEPPMGNVVPRPA